MFPVFKETTGMTQCPTMVIRADNVQMRSVPEQMEESLETGDTDVALGVGETVPLLIEQHNMKKEGMLCPMVYQNLRDQTPNLIQRMKAFE